MLDLHAPALGAKVKGVVAVAPYVLRRCGAFLDVNFDFGRVVVCPSYSIATAEGALAFVDKGGPAWCGDGNATTVAGGFDGSVGHLFCHSLRLSD